MAETILRKKIIAVLRPLSLHVNAHRKYLHFYLTSEQNSKKTAHTVNQGEQ